MPLVQADAMFADLICEDLQWPRAEFGALISASFGKPPVPPPRPSRVPPHPGLHARPRGAVGPAPPSPIPRRQTGTPPATLSSGCRAA